MAHRWPRKCNHCGFYLMRTAYNQHKQQFGGVSSCVKNQENITEQNIQQGKGSEVAITLQSLESEALLILNQYKYLPDSYTQATEQIFQVVVKVDAVSCNNDEELAQKELLKSNLQAKLHYFDEKHNLLNSYQDTLAEGYHYEISTEVTSEEHHTMTSSSDEDTSLLLSQENGGVDEVWDEGDVEELPDEQKSNENPQVHKLDILLSKFISFLFAWQSMFKVSSNALQVLFTGIRLFVLYLGEIFALPPLVDFARALKISLPSMRLYAGLKRDDFQTNISCSKCDSVYKYDEGFYVNSRGRKIPKACSFTEYPNHKHYKFRKPCGALLMKKIGTLDGKEFVYPKRVFCYRSIKDSIKEIAGPNFYSKCTAWRKEQNSTDRLKDIYDGALWKEYFKSYLDLPGLTIGVLLNVDWFQPYKHSSYSVGVVSLVLLNLPPCERYKLENRIVVCILPGPRESKLTVNTYLNNFVTELLVLKEGFLIQDGSPFGNICRVILMGVTADIPAVRKVIGFMGHGAEKGCSKCVKSFTRKKFGDRQDCSGFDELPLRSSDDHRYHVSETLEAQNITDRRKLESKYGVRYSVLLRLPYFDAIRHHTIDPLHNLFLGTAKTLTQHWIHEKILSQANLEKIQASMNLIKVPSDLGRIPNKIACHFAGFTGDEWKNWILVYSLICLKGILDDKHYVLWSLFVKACVLIVSKEITIDQIWEAHRILVAFCKRFEVLIGKDKCTMNLHLHQHLKNCILDYGPIYSFWCFAFERMNGILGSYPNNKHLIEVQMMRKFLEFKQSGKNTHENYDFNQLLKSVNQRGSLFETESSTITGMLLPFKELSLTLEDREDLTAMVGLYYPDLSVLDIDHIKRSHRLAKVNGKSLVVESKRQNRYCSVIVNPGDSHTDRVCIIEDLLTFGLLCSFEQKQHKKIFEVIKVKYYLEHTEESGYARPVKIVSPDYDRTMCPFVPLSRVKRRCVTCSDFVQFTHGKDRAVIVMPLPEF